MSIKNKQKPHSSCSVFLSQYYFGYLGFFVCIQIVKYFALILWRMSLLIWLELHWISRLLWVIYSCSLYWFFQSKNTIYLSICIIFNFFPILEFSEYRYFASLGRFIPRCFIIFDMMVNETVSLISHSDLLLLVYRNTRDLWPN